MLYRRTWKCAGFLGFGLMALAAQAQELMVFSTFPQGNPKAEVAEAVLRVAYQTLGMEIRVEHVPGERALLLSNGGQVDGELFRSSGLSMATYPNLIRVDVPIANVDVVAFAKNVKFRVAGWESLRPYTIGVERGFKMLEEGTKGMQTHVVGSVEQTFNLLNIGRVDVVLQDRMEGLLKVKEMALPGIHVLEPPVVTGYVYHFLNKKHADLVPRLKAALSTMEKAGKIKRIQAEVSGQLLE